MINFELCSISSENLKQDTFLKIDSNIGNKIINKADASGADVAPATRSVITLFWSTACSSKVNPTQTSDGIANTKLISKSFSLERTLSIQRTANTPEVKPIISEGYLPVSTF